MERVCFFQTVLATTCLDLTFIGQAQLCRVVLPGAVRQRERLLWVEQRLDVPAALPLSTEVIRRDTRFQQKLQNIAKNVSV